MIRRVVRRCGLVMLMAALFILPTGVVIKCGTVDMGTLGGADSIAAGVNDAEQVVGGAETADGTWHAFLWQRGSTTDLGTLGGDNSEAHDISQGPDPLIVGTAELPYPESLPPVVERAFLWQAGVMTDLGTLGGDSSEAWAVSDDGKVVGSAQTADHEWHAFLWQAGSMTDLGTLGGDQSCALDVNGAGQVVGFSMAPAESDDPNDITPPLVQRAFLWTAAGGMTDLGTLGGHNSGAYGISEDGYAVGWADTAAGDPNDPWDPNVVSERHVFVWSAAGGMTDLGTLGGPVAEAWGVSSYAVTGYSLDANGVYDGISWTWSGALQPLGQPLGVDGPVFGYRVNGAGGVAGSAKNSLGQQHGFFRRLPLY